MFIWGWRLAIAFHYHLFFHRSPHNYFYLDLGTLAWHGALTHVPQVQSIQTWRTFCVLLATENIALMTR